MMGIEIVDGIPVKTDRRVVPFNIRVKEKPKGAKPKKRKPSPLKLGKKARQELNLKQRRALKNYYSGMPKQKAGMEAGYAPTSAINAVNNAIELAAGNEAFVRAMEKEGITNERLAQVLSEGLEATNPFRPNQKDYKVIHSFWQDAVKARDGFPATRINQRTESKHMHVHLTADDYRAVEKYKKYQEEDDGESEEHRQKT